MKVTSPKILAYSILFILVFHVYTHTHMYIYMHIDMCVHLGLCVYECILCLSYTYVAALLHCTIYVYMYIRIQCPLIVFNFPFKKLSLFDI